MVYYHKGLIMINILKTKYEYRDGDLYSLKHNRQVGVTVKRASGLSYKIVVPTINGTKKKLYAHRVIWMLINGPIPQALVIGHIDGDGLNNNINNLRAVTKSENSKNAKLGRNNSSGHTGVFQDIHANGFKKWRAFINIDKKRKYLGRFYTKEEAVKARLEYEKEHGYISR